MSACSAAMCTATSQTALRIKIFVTTLVVMRQRPVDCVAQQVCRAATLMKRRTKKKNSRRTKTLMKTLRKTSTTAMRTMTMTTTTVMTVTTNRALIIAPLSS
jgi:hypothetical protein